MATLVTEPDAASPGFPLPALHELEEARSNTHTLVKVISAVGRDTTTAGVLTSTLEAVKSAFGYDYGACWMIDHEEGHTSFRAESGNLGPAFDRVNRETHYRKGQGLTGRTWADADVIFIPHLRAVTNSELVNAACSAGVEAAISFPFIVNEEVHGVLFFFSFTSINSSEDRRSVLRNIGRLVGQAFSRLLDLERETQEHRALQQTAEQILSVVRAAQQGDLTRIVPAAGSDAIGQVAKGLSEFLANLRQSVRGIADHAGGLNTAAEHLNQLSVKMRSRSTETSVTAAAVSIDSREVSANIENIAAGSAQMLASMYEIAKGANEAASGVHEALQTTSSTRETIGQLVSSAADIGNMSKVIESIARQTRLLALNASIEAARAGTAGLGFTVVANEVKQLAAGTADATRQIAEKIETIQMHTASAVESIGEVATVIERVSELSGSIAHTADQQSAATREIGESVGHASVGSTSISEKIANVADVARSAEQEASETLAAAEDLTRLAAQLRSLVCHFKVD